MKTVVDIQAAFDFIQKDIAAIQSLACVNLTINKMVLRALVDLDLVQRESLRKALQELADGQDDPMYSKIMIGIIQSIKLEHQQTSQAEPMLKLVHSQPEAQSPKTD